VRLQLTTGCIAVDENGKVGRVERVEQVTDIQLRYHGTGLDGSRWQSSDPHQITGRSARRIALLFSRPPMTE
jgi:hypothetical protein